MTERRRYWGDSRKIESKRNNKYKSSWKIVVQYKFFLRALSKRLVYSTVQSYISISPLTIRTKEAASDR